jgi:hypothetical protein
LANTFWAVWEKAWWVFGIIIVAGFLFLANKNPVLLVRLLSLFFVLAGIVMVIYVRRMLRQQRQSSSWAPVEGRVLSSNLEKEVHRSRPGYNTPITGGGITTYFPRVEYEYEYQGESYQSKRIITVNINWPKKEAEEAVARYPEGTSVTVWVNPDHPDQAVLETNLECYTKKFKIAFFIGTAFLVVGIVGWLVSPLFK